MRGVRDLSPVLAPSCRNAGEEGEERGEGRRREREREIQVASARTNQPSWVTACTTSGAGIREDDDKEEVIAEELLHRCVRCVMLCMVYVLI